MSFLRASSGVISSEYRQNYRIKFPATKILIKHTQTKIFEIRFRRASIYQLVHIQCFVYMFYINGPGFICKKILSHKNVYVYGSFLHFCPIT